MSVSIIGTGSCVPSRTVTNNDLAEFMDTSDEWITTRTGIRERRICTTESITELAIGAAKAALENAGVTADSLDLILCTVVKGEYITPSMACLVQKGVGASCPAFDVNAACSGFVYGLDVADAYITGKKLQKVLLISVETMSKMADWDDRATCVLFGDGAGAVILAPGDGLKEIRLTADGNADILYCRSAPSNCPYGVPGEPAPTYLKMNGQEVYKFAVPAVEADIAYFESKGYPPEKIRYFLLHQANKRIIDSARNRTGQPAEKFPMNIERYGNTSSASIPILLDEMNRQGRLQQGDLLLLSAFGAGLTTGACIIAWGN